MKVKLKIRIVLDGGVWFPGDVVDLPDKDGQMMIAHGKAERFSGQLAVGSTPLSDPPVADESPTPDPSPNSRKKRGIFGEGGDR